MTAPAKPLPKSLHTVTAIVRVARFIYNEGCPSRPEAIADAIDILGYRGAADPYGLAAASLKQMTA